MRKIYLTQFITRLTILLTLLLHLPFFFLFGRLVTLRDFFYVFFILSSSSSSSSRSSSRSRSRSRRAAATQNNYIYYDPLIRPITRCAKQRRFFFFNFQHFLAFSYGGTLTYLAELINFRFSWPRFSLAFSWSQIISSSLHDYSIRHLRSHGYPQSKIFPWYVCMMYVCPIQRSCTRQKGFEKAIVRARATYDRLLLRRQVNTIQNGVLLHNHMYIQVHSCSYSKILNFKPFYFPSFLLEIPHLAS